MIGPILLLLATAAAAQTHSTTITHAGTPVALTYQASTAISHRQVGSVAPPGKPSTLRCLWSATVAVERRATRDGAPIAALSRRLPTGERLTGSRAGACGQLRAAIAGEVASRTATGLDLAATAERDRAAVTAELAGLEALTGRRG